MFRCLAAIFLYLIAAADPSFAFVRGGSSGSSIAPYLGSCCTRTAIPTGADGVNFQLNSRTGHFQRAAMPQGMSIVFSNFFMQDNALPPGVLVRAALEYPAGVCRMFTWGGSTTLTSVTVNTKSDPIANPPPVGAEFWTRFFLDGTAAGAVPLGREYAKNLSMGDALEQGVSGLPDRTDCLTSVPDNGDAQNNFQPSGLVGLITVPSFTIFGDSIAYGNNDAGDTTGDVGAIARAIGGSFGSTNTATPGDQAQQFVATHTYRLELAQYSSHIFLQYGTNDFFLGHRTSAQVQADLATIRSFPGIAGKPVIQVTISPNTSTPVPPLNPDGWKTLAGQVILNTTDNNERVAYNGVLRAGIAGVAHFAEQADVMESARNSGLWCADGVTTALCTSDGIHPSPLVYQNLKPTINLGWFTYPCARYERRRRSDTRIIPARRPKRVAGRLQRMAA